MKKETFKQRTLDWFRNFGIEMSSRGVDLPTEMGDVSSVVDSLVKWRDGDWNCRCLESKPNGVVCIPKEGEGNYQRCLICDRRIYR